MGWRRPIERLRETVLHKTVGEKSNKRHGIQVECGEHVDVCQLCMCDDENINYLCLLVDSSVSGLLQLWIISSQLSSQLSLLPSAGREMSSSLWATG